MAGNTTCLIGQISATAANILSPGALTGGVGYTYGNWAIKITITRIRVINVDTASAHNFKFFRGATGATAAGTEVGFNVQSIPAASTSNSPSAPNYVDEWFDEFTLLPGQYLVGIADTNSVLTFNIEYRMELIQIASP